MIVTEATVSIQASSWPFFGWVDDIRPALRAAFDARRVVAIGTLFRTQGSAPRPVGTQMLFDGVKTHGYFSGDCVEADVALHAATVRESGAPATLLYGAGSPWLDIRLNCGGSLEIFLERLEPDDQVMLSLLDALVKRQPCVVASDGHRRQFIGSGSTSSIEWRKDPFEIRKRYDPVPRLVIVGGDPISLAIASLGAQSGFETMLVRPGGPERGPDIAKCRYISAPAAEALACLGLDAWTAVICASHDNDIDLPVVATSLRSSACYVGLLGAESRLPERLNIIAQLGASAAEIDRLKAPIGIARLGKAPWQVAVSVIADVMQAFQVSGAHT